MATNRDQRQYDRAPRSGRIAPACILAATLAVLLAGAAALVLVSTGGRGRSVSHEAPAFLRRALGDAAPAARGALVRRSPGGLTARVHRNGYTLEQRGASLTLSSAAPSSSPWRRYRNGAARATPFGSEAITLDGPRTEQFLSVGRRAGPRTWRWHVDAGTLEPSLRSSGVVDFHAAGASGAGFRVLAVKILDARGRDVTPSGLRWRLERDRGGLLLALDLDDSRLPVPYVIDPAAITLNGTPSTANNGAGATSLTIAAPSGVAPGDLLLAQVSVRGGSGATVTPPSGWTMLRRDNQSSNLAQIVFWHVAASGDPGSWTWSFGTTSRAASGGIVGYAGVQNPSPLQTMAGIGGPTTTSSPYAPSVTTSAPDALLVTFLGQPSTGTWTAPSGMTLRYQTASGSTSSMVADVAVPSAGATGTKTASVSVASTWVGQSLALAVDTTPPTTPTVSLSESSASAYTSGQTLWYRPAGSGSFTVDASSSDAESGIDRLELPALGGFTPAGVGTVNAASGSYTYSWSGAGTASGTQTVSAYDRAGNVSTGTFTMTPDSTAPTGQTISLTGGTTTSTLSIGFATGDGSDAGVGLDTATRRVERASAPLSNGTCGAFGAFAGSYASPDTSVVSGNCYEYRFSIADRVGNRSASVTTAAVKVDTGAPAPTLALAETPASAAQHVSGTTLYYRPGVAGGGFQVTATVGDDSGVASVDFPAIAGVTGGGGDTTSPFQGSYTWDAATAASGAQTVTATSGTGLTSTATFTLAQDSTPPSGGSVTYAEGWSGGSVTIATADGTDSGSGLDAASGVLERQAATLSGGVCGTYGAWSAVTSPDTLPGGTCAVYRYRVSDNVGNTATSTSASVVKVDTTAPAAPSLAFGSFTNATASGSTVWYRPGAAGGFTVTATGTDPESGIASTSYPDLGSGWTGAGGGYTFGATAAEPGAGQQATVTNGAGLASAAATFAVRSDSTAPTTSIACDGAACTSAWSTSPVTVTLAATDGGSGLDAIRYTLDGSAPDAASAVYSGPLTVSETTTMRYAAVDRVGNVEAAGSQLVRVDTTPPSTPTLAFSGLDNASAAGATVWYRPSAAGSFTVEAASSDAQSGVASTAYPDLGAGWTRSGGAYSWTTAPTAPAGAQTVTVTNGAGLASSAELAASPDSAPPTTTITCDGSACDGGWTTLDSLVALDATDAGSGVAAVRYTLDGSEPTALSPVYGAPFTITGTTTVKWAAVDAVGNVEPTGTQVVRVDTKTPTVTLTAPADGDPLRATATLAADAADEGSGVDRVRFALSADAGATWTQVAVATAAPWQADWDTTAAADGSYELRPVALDVAGNTTVGAAATVLVDNTPPAAAIDSPGATVNAPVTLTSTATDAGSGVASRSYEYSVAGAGDWRATPALWDTSGLADGDYDLRVVVLDAAGNRTVSEPVRTTLDQTPPTGSPTAPTDGALVHGSVAIASDSADAGSGVAAVRFQGSSDDGANWQELAADGVAPYGFDWDTTAAADGAWKLRVVTTDAAGNAGTSAPIGVDVDNTPPAATLADPGAVVGGTVTLASTVTDGGSGVATTTYELSPAGADDWRATPASWDTTALADGDYDLRVVATDLAGNRAVSATRTTLVDNHAPAVAITSPTRYVSAAAADPLEIAAASEDADVASVELFVCSDGSSRCSTGAWSSLGTDTTAPYGRPWTLPADGPIALRAVATDVAGNIASDIVDVLVDRTAPSGGSIGYVGGFSAGDPVLLAADRGSDAGSGLGAGAATIQRDEAVLSGGACGAWAGAWQTVSAPDAAVTGGRCYRYRLRVEDLAGNVARFSAAAVVSVDTTAPTVSLSLSESSPWSDASGTTVTTNPQGTHSGSFTVSAVADDPESGIAAVAFPAVYGSDGGSTAVAPYAHDYAWDASSTGFGVHTVTATNASGLAASADFSVAVDVDPPTGSSVSYADGYVTTTTATVTTAVGTDAGSGLEPSGRLLQRADATLSGGACGAFGAFATVAADPPATFGDLTVASGGCYRYRLVVGDRVGNVETATSAATVQVDAQAPTVTLADPGSVVRGTVSLSAVSADTGGSGVASVTYQIAPAGATTWTATTADWDTTALADGLYDLRAVAVDAAGNRTDSAVVAGVRVDNTPPSVFLTDPGTPLRGTVALDAASSDGGSGLASTGYEVSPAAAGSWTATPAAWDTTTLADGLYDVRAFAADDAGNRSESVASSRRVDNTPPTATVSGLAPYVRGTVELAADAQDAGSGVASTTFEARPAGGGWAAVPASLDTRGAADGAWDVRAVVTDAAGNRTVSAPVATSLDNTAPTAVLTDPGSPVSGTILLSSFTDDATSGIDAVRYEVRPSGGEWSAQPATWRTTDLPDGLYDLRVVADDRAGNETIDTKTGVRVDNTAPVVALVAPADSSYVNAASADPLLVHATATDPDGSGVGSVELFQCSDTSAGCATGVWASIGVDTVAPYTADWTIPGDGRRALRAVAVDGAGHSGAAAVEVVVDRSAPVAALVDPGPYLRGTVALSAGAADGAGSGVGSVTFQRSPAGAASWTTIAADGEDPYSADLDTTALADGLYDLRVFVTDLAGNTATDVIGSRRIDNTPPAATMTDPGANLRGTVTLASTASDTGGSGVDSRTYEVSPAGADAWSAVSPDWETTSLADGLYDVRVRVTDRAGNETVADPVAGVRVDNTAPSATMTPPDAAVRGAVTLTSDTDDEGSGVASVRYEVSPAGAGTWTTTPAAWDTTALADGLYDLRVVATDVAGNVRTSDPVTGIRVDNTPPTVSLADPGTSLRGTVTLSATADDTGGSGVASVVYQVAPTGSSTWAETPAALDTTSLADGLYDLRAVATDGAGNRTASTLVVGARIDNTAPTTTDNAPADVRSSAVTVNLSASDAGSGVGHTEVSVDGGDFQTGTLVVIPAPADHSNDGEHVIVYRSVDVAGNLERKRTAIVVIDTTPPGGSTTDPGATLRGSVPLSSDASDSDIASVAFEWARSGDTASDPWHTIGTDTEAPYSVVWDTTGVDDGSYDLRTVVADEAGLENVSTLPGKTVDNTAPTGAVTAPSAGRLVHGRVTLAASASDATSGVASVEFRVATDSGASFSETDTTAPYNVSWDTTSVADGPAELTVVVRDVAGNETTSEARAFAVDNQAPTVELGDPGAEVSGAVELAATAASDTVQVDFQRRPAGAETWSTFATDVEAPFAASMATGALADGQYELRAVATDGSGNEGASDARTVLVDNTAPTAALTRPAAGDLVGGPNVALAADAADEGGSGVASVTFQERAAAATGWTDVAVDEEAPYEATWDTTALPSGGYRVRVVVADGAGNLAPQPDVALSVDSTPPSVTLSDPGGALGGTVTLSASAGGAGPTQVAFERSPAGAGRWTQIGVAHASPWRATFDTTGVADGLYDLRAVVSDRFGNTAESLRAGVRVDNTPPRLVQSTPSEGAAAESLDTITLVASEPLAAVTGASLDGQPAAAPALSGSSAVFSTGSLGAGSHSLGGALVDGAGRSTPFLLHFRVGAPDAGDVTWVEVNAALDHSVVLALPDGSASVFVPPAVWNPADATQPGDWLVFRLDGAPPAPALDGGYEAVGRVIDVTSRWALSGAAAHHFLRPLDVVIANPTGAPVVPATFAGGWRPLTEIPSGGHELPDDRDDGFYVDGGVTHILTRHLSLFRLLHDVEPPSPPTGFEAVVADDGLTLRWVPGTDSSGRLGQVVLSVNGAPYASFDPTQLEAKLGPITGEDTRRFSVSQLDAAGNASAQTTALLAVPTIDGKTVDEATALLAARGFAAGAVTQVASAAPAGTVVAPGIRLAPEGSTIDLAVSTGAPQAAPQAPRPPAPAPAPAQQPGPVPVTRFSFSVVGTKRVPPAPRRFLGARIKASQPARVTASLIAPHGRDVYRWRLRVRAGESIVRLRLPSAVRAAGLYRIAWTAQGPKQLLRRTTRLRVDTRSTLAAAARRTAKRRVDVVVAGTTLAQLPRGLRPGRWVRVLSARRVDGAWALAGSSSRNVEVVVVDVDTYGTRVVHDLRTVFPGLRVLAVGDDPIVLERAVRLGAAAAVPRTAPQRLEREIRRVAGPGSGPAARDPAAGRRRRGIDRLAWRRGS